MIGEGKTAVCHLHHSIIIKPMVAVERIAYHRQRSFHIQAISAGDPFRITHRSVNQIPAIGHSHLPNPVAILAHVVEGVVALVWRLVPIPVTGIVDVVGGQAAAFFSQVGADSCDLFDQFAVGDYVVLDDSDDRVNVLAVLCLAWHHEYEQGN